MPVKTTIPSKRKNGIDSFIPVYFETIKVKISIPPVEPPAWKVSEQPTPTKAPPSIPIINNKPISIDSSFKF